MARKRKGRAIHGWLILDKAVGPTSSQCVGRIKWLTEAAKVGHGGTLDPLASGILPIAFGEATKTQQFAMDGQKKYEFTITWGRSTDTLDAEGKITAESGKRPLQGDIEAALPHFVGSIEQVPPQFSAVKVDGERAYKHARAEQEVKLEPRSVQIESFQLKNISDDDEASFEVCCGKGTYVRALARDLALHLGVEGHISRLRRTAVGPFSIDRAVSIETLGDERGDMAVERLSEFLLPIETVLDDIPALALTEQETRKLRHGQGLPVLPVIQRSPGGKVSQGDLVQVTSNGSLVALAQIVGGEIRPVRVLNV